MEHFYTIRYDTFLHIFLRFSTYQKSVFYAGILLRKIIIFKILKDFVKMVFAHFTESTKSFQKSEIDFRRRRRKKQNRNGQVKKVSIVHFQVE